MNGRTSGHCHSTVKEESRAMDIYMTMKVWIVLSLFACFSVSMPAAVEVERRRCEFLTTPGNYDVVVKQMQAGNVSGTVQYCANTRCCMGIFILVNGEALPELQGCDIFPPPCPDPKCSVLRRVNNRVICKCNSDFCNANITWNVESTQSGNSFSLDMRNVKMAMILLPLFLLLALMILCVANRVRSCYIAREKLLSPLQTPDGKVCSSIRRETPDLDLSNLQLQQMIARGSCASVWRGGLGRSTVAVKVFAAAHSRSFAREREVLTLPLLQHPGLVLFLGAGREPEMGRCFLVLELAKHGSLRSFLSLHTTDWASAVKLAQSLSQGLAYLHSELHRNGVYKPAVAHCDLSSSNVLVRADSTCALCDFSCAAVLQPWMQEWAWQRRREAIQPRPQVGTLRYMAPEVLEGFVNLKNEWCLLQGDIYSLGLLLWEMWSRCADLYAVAAVPEHRLPYEKELGPSPSLGDFILFVSERRGRPLLPTAWEHFSQGCSMMREILDDCWDHEPDARLTAQCAAERVTALPPHCT